MAGKIPRISTEQLSNKVLSRAKLPPRIQGIKTTKCRSLELSLCSFTWRDLMVLGMNVTYIAAFTFFLLSLFLNTSFHSFRVWR